MPLVQTSGHFINTETIQYVVKGKEKFVISFIGGQRLVISTQDWHILRDLLLPPKLTPSRVTSRSSTK